MNAKGIEAMAAHQREPVLIDGFLVTPNDWSALDPAALIKPGPSAVTLKVHTLSAVRDFLKANRDKLDLDGLSVYVQSPSSVWVVGPIATRARTREHFVSATCLDTTEGWVGKFHSMEEFLIGLQTRFTDAEDRANVLRLLSNVKHEVVKQSLDDGQTQVVQARAGIALVSDVAVPNPVRLTPYRTFRDVLQPSSPFVLRLQSGRQGGLPEAALFEADAGTWKLGAIERIADWLKEALTGVDVAILA